MATNNLIVNFPSRRGWSQSMPSSAAARAPHRRVSCSNSSEPSRRVSFSRSTTVQVVVDVSTEDVLSDLYYSKSDIQSIKRGIRRELMEIRAKSLTLAEVAEQNISQVGAGVDSNC